jgi:hypothetical protein
MNHSFPPLPSPGSGSKDEWGRTSSNWRGLLRDKVFRNWPDVAMPPNTRVTADRARNHIRVRLVEFRSDQAYQLTAVLLTDATQSRLSFRPGFWVPPTGRSGELSGGSIFLRL